MVCYRQRDSPSWCVWHRPPSDRLQTRAGRQAYEQRKSTIEPVFGIIKEVMGFRRFSLRGLSKVNLEWKLVSLSYNLKRLFHMGVKLQSA
jgi:hypothetical protein